MLLRMAVGRKPKRCPSPAISTSKLWTQKPKTTMKGTNRMKTKIINYIRAGYPGLYLVSPEEQRVELELKSVAAEMKFNLFVWSVTAGMLDTAKGSVRECNDPLEALL